MAQKFERTVSLDEDSAQLYINFGSSYKTSDFIVDSIEQWWSMLSASEQDATKMLQIKVDNGPESSGVRTQFLHRMVQFANRTKTKIQLLYYPPYHSKYNPIERCWGILEKHCHGSKLLDLATMLVWARTMKWKGINPIVNLSTTVYQKGISLSETQKQELEMLLQRNPELPKWDILIQPS